MLRRLEYAEFVRRKVMVLLELQMESGKRQTAEKLYLSLEALENAVRKAKASLSLNSNVPAEIIDRIDSYDEILVKQRTLIGGILSERENENWPEVLKQIHVVSELSKMIKDDVLEVLKSLRGEIVESSQAKLYH